jgi:lipoprotein-anchoring transpeptidase ErfK/SrfK
MPRKNLGFQMSARSCVSLLTAAAALWVGAAVADPLPQAQPGLAPNLARQVVDYPTSVAAGTVVIDTAQTYLYYVLGDGKAIRYGIGVGRVGFTWSGTQTVTRKAEWPDWTPPAQMIARQPSLPRWMAGGEGNPLGARAIYLGSTIYRIHGTNMPETIGHKVSSGCIRMLNADVVDLYSRVAVGTKIVVLANHSHIARAIPAFVVPARIAASHTGGANASSIY